MHPAQARYWILNCGGWSAFASHGFCMSNGCLRPKLTAKCPSGDASHRRVLAGYSPMRFA